MPADVEQLIHAAAAQPSRPLDVGALNARRLRRRARRRTLAATACVAIVAVAVISLAGPGNRQVDFLPADEGGEEHSSDEEQGADALPVGDPVEMLGLWEVHGAGEEPDTILRLDADQAVLIRACGTVSGPWRAHGEGLFVQGPNGWSGPCGDVDPTPEWLRAAAAHRSDGEDRLLLDAAGAVVARLVPGDLDPVPQSVWEGHAEPPVPDASVRGDVGPPAPLDAALTPADATSLLGRWHPEGTYSPEAQARIYAELASDGTWGGSDGCNAIGGRWRAGPRGAFVGTAGTSTDIGCENAPIGPALSRATRAGFDRDVLVLLDRHGIQVGRFTRADPASGSGEAGEDVAARNGVVLAHGWERGAVLLDVATGEELGRVAAHGGEASPVLSAAPGGDVVFHDVHQTGSWKQIVSTPLDGGEGRVVTDGRRPAVSPDGRRLAYVASNPTPVHDVTVAVRDLGSGEEEHWTASAEDGEALDVAALSWAADSTRLVLELTRSVRDETTIHPPDRFEVRVLDTSTVGALLDSRLLTPADPRSVWRAPVWRGDTDEVAVVELCCDLDGWTVWEPAQVRVISVDVGSGAAAALLEHKGLLTALASDPTGEQLALIATDPKDPGVHPQRDRLLHWDGQELHEVAEDLHAVTWVGAAPGR